MVPITICFDNIFGRHTTAIANWIDSLDDNDYCKDKSILEDIIAGNITDDSWNDCFKII